MVTKLLKERFRWFVVCFYFLSISYSLYFLYSFKTLMLNKYLFFHTLRDNPNRPNFLKEMNKVF